jgi:hypothetical protein
MNKLILDQFGEELVEVIARLFFWGCNLLEITEVGHHAWSHHAIKPILIFMCILGVQLLTCKVIHDRKRNLNKDVLHSLSEVAVLILTVTIF